MSACAPAIAAECRRVFGRTGAVDLAALVEDAALGAGLVEYWLLWSGDPDALTAEAIAREPVAGSRAVFVPGSADETDDTQWDEVFLVDLARRLDLSDPAALDAARRRLFHAMTRARRRLVLAGRFNQGQVSPSTPLRSYADLLLQRVQPVPDLTVPPDRVPGTAWSVTSADGVRWVVL